MKKGKAQLMNQDSGDVERYTPQWIIELARTVLGGRIDVDPASCEEANKRIKALRFYDKIANGLHRPWNGDVWMNHPYSKIGNLQWIDKFCWEYTQGRMRAGLCITFVSTSEKWFQPLLLLPQCFLNRRVDYDQPEEAVRQAEADGKEDSGPPKGSCISYQGSNLELFADTFAPYGTIKIPYGYR